MHIQETTGADVNIANISMHDFDLIINHASIKLPDLLTTDFVFMYYIQTIFI